MTTDIAAQRKAALDDMVAKMSKTGEDSTKTGFTQGWDIVVSYSENAINENLKRKWQLSRNDPNRNMITSIDIFSSSYNDDTAETTWSYRTLELGPPRIEFEGKAVMEPACHLVLPVEGIYYQRSNEKREKVGEKKKQLEVANPYDIRLTGIKLGSVKGKYETIMKPKNEGIIASAKTLPVPIDSSRKTVLFREDNTKPTQDDFENAWVVLDFPMGGSNFGVNIENNIKPGEPQHDRALAMEKNIQGAVTDYFKKGPAKIDVLEYALATIKNKPQYDGGITGDLTPVSFQFATHASSYNPEATLSLFIHTMSGTDSGEKNDLQVKWMASWTNRTMSPIPTGYTASLLINPLLAYKAMVKAGLEKDGQYKVEALNDDADGGLTFSARYQRCWNVSSTSYPYSGKVYDCTVWIDGWDKVLKDDPVKFKIFQKQTDAAPVVQIDWDFYVENKWKDVTTNKHPITGHIIFMEQYMRTDYKLHTQRDLKIAVTSSEFTFTINTDDLHTKWDATTRERDPVEGFWSKVSRGLNNLVSASPPDDVTKLRENWMKSLKPTFHFKPFGLGFFLTTNLLNPGAKVIKIDSNVLRIPRDILLVGDVTQGTDTIKSG